MPTKRVHSPEFKVKVALRGYLESQSESDTSNPWSSELTIAQIARESDVNPTLVRNWVKKLEVQLLTAFV